MPSCLSTWCVPIVVFSCGLSCSATLAGTHDGIRMWRDGNGVLNITNIHSFNRISASTDKAKASVTVKPSSAQPSAAKFTIPSVAEMRKVAPTTVAIHPTVTPKPLANPSGYTNIYAYVDTAGVKHFTNVPTGDQRYALVLHERLGGPSPLTGLLTSRRSAYDNIVAEASRTYQVDQALVRAMIHTESAFNPMAVSPKGAAGLMQLMPDTAHRYGVHDAFDPTENVYGGVRYLRDLLDMFDNNLPLAVAAYNAGENAVTRYGGIPPYAETTDYVQRVLSLHTSYLNKNINIKN
ncbi:soluble lytic murein transglycosylase [Gammaproteobacteria bacterium]